MTEKENLVLTMASIIQSLKILEKAQNNINRENNRLEEQTVSYKKTKDLLEKSLEETIRLLNNTTKRCVSFANIIQKCLHIIKVFVIVMKVNFGITL